MGSERFTTHQSRGVHLFALFAALWALGVISIGGLVTSKGVGMAVPDWPTTYGYNMFFFPFRLWEGGIFHEHLHRLVASCLGLWTLILAAWISLRGFDPRLRQLSWAAVVIVVVQGILGGKRVLLNSVDVMGISGSVFFGVFHAVTAQVFLVILCMLALFTHPRRNKWAEIPRGATSRIRSLFLVVMAVGTLLQLAVGAGMRHQHAGLAIPDFPLAYGSLLPSTDADALKTINQRRLGVVDDVPVTAFQIWLQMTHRGIAGLLVTGALALALLGAREQAFWRRALRVQACLYVGQFCLGAATIWTNKAADIATAHVALGAATLSLVSIMASLRVWAERQNSMVNKPCSHPKALLKSSAVPVGGSLS